MDHDPNDAPDTDQGRSEADEPLTSYLPPSYTGGAGTLAGEDEVVEPERSGWVSLTALRVTLGRVPLWLLTALVPITFAAIAALPWLGWFRDALGHHYAPGSQLAWLDSNFRADHAGALGDLRSSTGVLTSAFSALMFLVGIFCAGGWLQVFLERTEGHSMHRFFFGGVRYFWRFFRVFLAVLVLLGAGSYLIYGDLWNEHVLSRFFGIEDGKLEMAPSERVARNLVLFRDGLFLLWFGAVLTWADYVRTRLAFLQSRAVVWAGLATFFTMLLRPVVTLRPILALLVAELLVVLGLGWISASLNHGFDPGHGLGRVGTIFALGLVVLLWRTVVRAARYHACVQVTRTVCEPLGVDDPWENTVGGPGGPRYPVGEEDFEISL